MEKRKKEEEKRKAAKAEERPKAAEEAAAQSRRREDPSALCVGPTVGPSEIGCLRYLWLARASIAHQIVTL